MRTRCMMDRFLHGFQWAVRVIPGVDFGARRPADKARRPRIPGVFEGGATRSAGMPRPKAAPGGRSTSMFRRFFEEGLAQSSYLLACGRTRQAVVIDTRRDIAVYVSAALEAGLTITHAIDTH